MARRSGLTLLELIVVIAIIGILMALLLPAVQYAREMSRRIQCSSNLRQFFTAVSLYEASWRVFPPGANLQYHSVHYTCLPYLEQTALVEAALADPTLSVPFYLCPSDGGAPVITSVKRATTNYVCNSGTWWHAQRGFDGPFRWWDDWAKGGPPLGAADMTRGLSNTSGLSEIIHADGTWHRMKVHWETPQTFTSYAQIDDFCKYCTGLPADPRQAGMVGNRFLKGAEWKNGSVSITLFNHVTPPNAPSCLNHDSVIDAAISASSFHDGIVFVAYLDGHVSTCSDQIDIATWRSLAPR